MNEPSTAPPGEPGDNLDEEDPSLPQCDFVILTPPPAPPPRRPVLRWNGRLFASNILMICGFLAAVFLLLVPHERHRDEPPQAQPPAEPAPVAVDFNNPLYPEFEKIARTEHLDLSFTRNVVSLSPHDSRLYEDGLSFPIFCNEKQSLDVILVGDSTLSWGVIPRVIEQMTGLRVGMFAFRSMYLNRRSLAIAGRVIRYYLKPGGLTIFGFTVWTQLQDPGIFRRGELVKLEDLSDDEFETFARNRFGECGVQPTAATKKEAADQQPTVTEIARQISRAGLFSSESYRSYRSLLGACKSSIPMPQIGFRESPLERSVREWLNPPYFSEQQSPKASLQSREPEPAAEPLPNARSRDSSAVTSLNQFQFLRWDKDTFTLVGPFDRHSIPSRSPADDRTPPSRNLEENARALLAIPGRKAFLITFYAGDSLYVQQRSIYKRYYSNELKLIDLGILHPDNESIPMDTEDHPANTGGLKKSILIGRWLRNQTEGHAP